MKFTPVQKSILKRRAFEMVIFLYHAERLRHLIIHSIQATDRLQGKQRLPKGQKRLLEKALKVLTEENILSEIEREEVESLIEHRNTIAHDVALFTGDISPSGRLPWPKLEQKYNSDALKRLEYFSKQIQMRSTGKFVQVANGDWCWFYMAEEVYRHEIDRLDDQIARQTTKSR